MTVEWRNALHPVSLTTLAEYLRDQTWLDVRICDHGPVERVQVMNVTVWADREDVTLRQQVVRRGVDGEDVISELELEADAEDIMWAKPSAFTEPLDVREAQPDDPAKPPDSIDMERVFDTTADAVAFIHQMSRAELDKELSEITNRIGPACLRRYQVLWTMREVLHERVGTLEICQRIGWRSVQPYHSAKDKFVGWKGQHAAEWEKILAPLEDIVRARL